VADEFVTGKPSYAASSPPGLNRRSMLSVPHSASPHGLPIKSGNNDWRLLACKMGKPAIPASLPPSHAFGFFGAAGRLGSGLRAKRASAASEPQAGAYDPGLDSHRHVVLIPERRQFHLLKGSAL